MISDNRTVSQIGSNTSNSYKNININDKLEVHNFITKDLYDKMPAPEFSTLQEIFKQHFGMSQSSSQYNINTSNVKDVNFDNNMKGGPHVDWQEKYIDKLDRDLSEIKTSIIESEKRIELMIGNTLAEIRDRDNQRHLEVLAVNERLDTNSSEIRAELRTTTRWIIGLAITTILAIASIAISVWVSSF